MVGRSTRFCNCYCRVGWAYVSISFDISGEGSVRLRAATRASPRAIAARRRSSPSMSMVSLRHRAGSAGPGGGPGSRAGRRRSRGRRPGRGTPRPGCDALELGPDLARDGDLPGIRGSVPEHPYPLRPTTPRDAAIEDCPMAAVGGHLQACDHCGAEGPVTIPAASATARSARHWRRSAGSRPAGQSSCQCPTSIWSSPCATRSTRSPS
jgi:hypothetical protein